MKNRISSIMDTSKKKAGVVVLCVTLIAIIGAGTAFAINSASPKEVAAANAGTDIVNPPAGELNIKETFNIGNYSEFLKVENDSVRYYYNGHWVRSLYDENNPDARLINEKARSIIYFNAVEDKDISGKGTPIYLKTVRNKDTNKIEKLVGMSEEEAWEILNGTDESIINMARTPLNEQKMIFNMGNYSEFLKVENDSVRYYYDGHWVRSLYDENNPDARLINEKARSIIYFNAVEDKDISGKGTPIYLKTVRNKDTNKIEKLVEMSEDEAWEILNGADESIINMARTPFDKN